MARWLAHIRDKYSLEGSVLPRDNFRAACFSTNLNGFDKVRFLQSSIFFFFLSFHAEYQVSSIIYWLHLELVGYAGTLTTFLVSSACC
jgi:hypothetical protein